MCYMHTCICSCVCVCASTCMCILMHVHTMWFLSMPPHAWGLPLCVMHSSATVCTCLACTRSHLCQDDHKLRAALRSHGCTYIHVCTVHAPGWLKATCCFPKFYVHSKMVMSCQNGSKLLREVLLETWAISSLWIWTQTAVCWPIDARSSMQLRACCIMLEPWWVARELQCSLLVWNVIFLMSAWYIHVEILCNGV